MAANTGVAESDGKMDSKKRDLFDNLRKEIRDEKVLNAMERVPRELFVPAEVRHLAYTDAPLPIGDVQTISQPYIVALMTSVLGLSGKERVMELGTGSGYQTAILSRLVPQGRVLSLERIPSLAQEAESRLQTMGYENIVIKIAGTALGCSEEGPFDAIIVTAASPRLPSPLLEQMAVNGRMVLPVGSLKEQDLIRVLRTSEGHTVTMLGACRFVPLIGQDAWPENYEEL